MDYNAKKSFIINFLYALIVAVLCISAGYLVIKFLFPFVIGAVIAYAVRKPAKTICRRFKLKEGIGAVILSVLLFLAAVSLFGYLIYKIILTAVDFVDYLPGFFKKLNDILNGIGVKYGNIFNKLPEDIKLAVNGYFSGFFTKIISFFANGITKFITGYLKKMPLIFISGVVTLVASCYISKDFVRLKKFVFLVLGESIMQKVTKVKNILIESVFKIFKSYLLLSLIAAVELFIGLLILGIKKPLLLAVIIAVIDFLPVLGAGTVIIPWAVIEILNTDYKTGIGLLIIYLVISVVRNFSEPKIVGMQVGVNSLFTLAAMFLGYKILGFTGIILFPVILIVTVQYYKAEMQ